MDFPYKMYRLLHINLCVKIRLKTKLFVFVISIAIKIVAMVGSAWSTVSYHNTLGLSI